MPLITQWRNSFFKKISSKAVNAYIMEPFKQSREALEELQALNFLRLNFMSFGTHKRLLEQHK